MKFINNKFHITNRKTAMSIDKNEYVYNISKLPQSGIKQKTG